MAGARRHRRGLFLFRRDLRLDDNRGLARAVKECDEVVPAFVFDPQQTGRHPWFSPRAFRFLLDSLAELSEAIAARGGRLQRFVGAPEEVATRLVREAHVDAVYANRDYTPFARSRDQRLAEALGNHSIPYCEEDDLLLCAPHEVEKKGGGYYTVFTPFHRRVRTLAVARPSPFPGGPLVGTELAGSVAGPEVSLYARGSIPAGRRAGTAILQRIGALAGYDTARNDLALATTSRLSAHHKFGTLSIRESYHAIRHALGAESLLLAQLHWRDFFVHVAAHFPRVFGRPFHRRYEGLDWPGPESHLQAWLAGRTGFPIVDAGMRELQQTGFMHNRARMITASFLTKDLHVDWRLGEQHFARLLVDYDPAVNNGSWQWAASTGCDAQPWFRIFSPWRQQERFDPEGEYVRRYVPELQSLTGREIRALEKGPVPAGIDYPPPIVDHRTEAARAKARYGQLARREEA